MSTAVGVPDPEPEGEGLRFGVDYTVGATSTTAAGAGWTAARVYQPTPSGSMSLVAWVVADPRVVSAARALPDPHDADDHVCHEDCPGWSWE